MKEIALLGGSRFIGVHLIQALCQRGHKVTIYNRNLTTPPVPYPDGVQLVKGNRNNPEDLRRLFDKEFDVVFDISGFTPKHVEPIAMKYRSCIKHYIFCSTPSVYKIPPPSPFDESAPRIFDENTYGGDKALVENILLTNYKDNQWPITIFRPSGVFGPYDPYKVGSVFYRLTNSLPIHTRNNYRANLLFVEDLVNAFLSAMNNPVSYGKIYGLGGDDITSPLEFIELCGKISTCPPVLNSIGNTGSYRSHDVGFSLVSSCNFVTDCRKVKSELGLRFTPLDEAINKTILWLTKNPSYLRRYALRGDKYELNNISVPRYAKVYWKGADLLMGCRSKIASIRWLKSGYNFIVRLLN